MALHNHCIRRWKHVFLCYLLGVILLFPILCSRPPTTRVRIYSPHFHQPSTIEIGDIGASQLLEPQFFLDVFVCVLLLLLDRALHREFFLVWIGEEYEVLEPKHQIGRLDVQQTSRLSAWEEATVASGRSHQYLLNTNVLDTSLQSALES